MFKYNLLCDGKEVVLILNADGVDSKVISFDLIGPVRAVSFIKGSINLNTTPEKILKSLNIAKHITVIGDKEIAKPTVNVTATVVTEKPIIEEPVSAPQEESLVDELVQEEEDLKPSKQGWYDTPSEILDNSESEEK